MKLIFVIFWIIIFVVLLFGLSVLDNTFMVCLVEIWGWGGLLYVGYKFAKEIDKDMEECSYNPFKNK